MKFFTLLLFVSAALAVPAAKAPIVLDDKCGAAKTVTRNQVRTRTVTVHHHRPTPGSKSGRGRQNNDGGDDRNDGAHHQHNDRPQKNNNGGGKNNNQGGKPPVQPDRGTKDNGPKNNGNEKPPASGGSKTVTTAAAPTQSQANGGKNGGKNNDSKNPQESLQLLQSQVQTNLFKDGQETPTEGQVASATSHNNFINFCATQNVPLTNGLQIEDGSCNPTPMGRIIAKNKVPSSKFVFPLNFSKIKANKAFTIKMAVKGIQTGNFVNPLTNYYAAPAQVNGNGEVIGHSHIVVEEIGDLQSTKPTNPSVFAFFKGVNGKAVNGVLSADVTNGLPKGVYRMSSINAAMNHQPILGATAQRGAIDDAVYFTVE